MALGGRVFILESPNPIDLLEGRGESRALEQICKLVGHKSASFLLRDKAELIQTCNYISSIPGSDKDKRPLFLHFSVHGNETCIGVGRDSVTWAELADTIGSMYAKLCYYHGPVIVILSACGANKQELTAALEARVASMKDPFVPPEFVFVFVDDTIAWVDAVVAWTVFYREAPMLNFQDGATVRKLLTRLFQSGWGKLRYHRWDGKEKRYMRFEPKI